MKIYCKVTERGLVPMYGSDMDEKRRLKVGETVLCEVTKPRNYEFHKKFFALVRLTFENLSERLSQMLSIRSEEDMLDCMKIGLGLYSSAWHGGRQVVKPGSISFAKMDETDFEKFYNRAVDMVLSLYLAGTDKEELLEEVERFY